MRRVSLVPVFVLSLLLTGCGGTGSQGCTAAFTYVPKPAYAGSYTGSFTPAGSSTVAATFTFSVSDLALVVGSVTAAGGNASITGTAGDIKNGCTNDTTGFVFDFNAVGGQSQQLTGVKSRNGSLTGTYVGTLTGVGASTVTGKFVITAASSQ